MVCILTLASLQAQVMACSVLTQQFFFQCFAAAAAAAAAAAIL